MLMCLWRWDCTVCICRRASDQEIFEDLRGVAALLLSGETGVWDRALDA